MIVALLGGLGLFLLGMVLMTDGLKALAGDALRRVLTRVVGGPARRQRKRDLLALIVRERTDHASTSVVAIAPHLSRRLRGESPRANWSLNQLRGRQVRWQLRCDNDPNNEDCLVTPLADSDYALTFAEDRARTVLFGGLGRSCPHAEGYCRQIAEWDGEQWRVPVVADDHGDGSPNERVRPGLFYDPLRREDGCLTRTTRCSLDCLLCSNTVK